MRRANHDRMAAPAMSVCAQCGSPATPHQACPSCGMYRGRQVIEISDEAASDNN